MAKKNPDRAAAVTQEAVNKVCDELTAKEIAPTLDRVRAELGGSYSTLSPMVKHWRASQQTEVQALFEMPETAMAAVRSLAAEMWRLASMEAVKRVEAAEAAAKQQVQTAQAEVAELGQIVESIENEAEKVSTEYDRLQQALAIVNGKRDELEKTTLRLEAEIEALRAQVERSESRNDTLQQELIALAREGNKNKTRK